MKTLVLFLCLTLVACSQHAENKTTVKKALANLEATAGNSASGTIEFIEKADGMQVKGKIAGIAPGKHGFHIHEYGDCSASDGKSAGSHFNPDNAAHGSPEDSMRHTGDMGNITADNQGNAKIDLNIPALSFSGRKSILGRAVILHSDADKFSQPAGDAGGRIACGVIGVRG